MSVACGGYRRFTIAIIIILLLLWTDLKAAFHNVPSGLGPTYEVYSVHIVSTLTLQQNHYPELM